MTLAWVLHTFEIVPLARALGWGEDQIAGTEAFRQDLIARLTRIAKPEIGRAHV